MFHYQTLLIFSTFLQRSFCFKVINETDLLGIEHRPETAYFFIFVVLFIANLIHYCTTRFKIPTPVGAFLIIIGIISGLCVHFVDELKRHVSFLKIPADSVMDFYLPIMIFKMVFFIDYDSFFHYLAPISVISILVYLLSSLFLGFLMTKLIHESWPAVISVLFGTLCMPIYPRLVLEHLQNIGGHMKSLQTLFAGESIMTIGICSMVYLIIVYPEHPVESSVAYFKSVVSLLITTILIQPIIGIIVGLLGNFLIKFFAEDPVYVTIFTLVLTILVYSGLSYFSLTGAITIFTMSMVMGMYKSTLPPKITKHLYLIWESLIFALNDITYVASGLCFANYAIKYMSFSDHIWIFVTYIMANVSRFVGLFIFLPLLKRISKGFSFRDMLIIYWCGLKNPLLLNMVMSLRKCDQVDFNTASLFLIHILGLFLTEFLINGSTIPVLLKVMGVTEISISKQINMNNCMKIILAKRERAIAVLKLDRLLSEANWLVVNTSTEITHPYKLKKNIEEINLNFGFKTAYCPDCKKQLQDEPTTKEFDEMIDEAEMRCARAKKISYTRQRESGMLSKNAFLSLVQSVESAMTTKDPHVEVNSVKKYFHATKAFDKLFNKSFRGYFSRAGDISIPPIYKCRRVCYDIVMSPHFATFIYVVLCLNFIEAIVLIIYNKRHSAICSINTIFAAIYLAEFVIKVCAYSRVYVIQHGLKTYFRSFWNLLDFVVLIFCLLDLILDYLDLLFPEIGSRDDYFVHIVLRMMRIIRFVQLIRYLRLICPKLLKFIDTKLDEQVVFAYEVGQGFVRGEDEVIETLPYMIHNEVIRREMRNRLQNNRLTIMRDMSLCSKGKPWISATVKTRQAAIMTLNVLNVNIKKLQTSGWTDEMESTKLMNSLQDRYKYTRSLTFITEGRPKDVFREIPWLNYAENVTDYLYSNIITKSYVPGEIVCKEGEILDGIFIVMTGFLLQSYTPNRKDLDMLTAYGILPIVDYPSLGSYEETFSDFIIQGNCFGELCFLTERPYCCQIIADMYCRLYIIRRKFLEEALKMDANAITGLKCRIWRSFAIRIAIPTLLSVPAYKSSDSMSVIKKALERSFMPDLSNFKTFIPTSKVEDLVLIEGMTIDYNTRIIYTGPCYIPRTVLKLTLTHYNNIEVKILVIPKREADEYEIMLEAENICEMVDVSISKSYKNTLKGSAMNKYRRKRRATMHFGQTPREAKMNSTFMTQSTSNYFVPNPSIEIPDKRSDIRK